MTRQGAIGATTALLALLGVFVLFGYVQQPTAALEEYAVWPPTAAAIRGKLSRAGAPGMSEHDRRELFCTMFKSRYRNHDPATAIGLRFVTPSQRDHIRLKLMCPARLEPFLVDRVALAAWREARDIFDKPVDVDIYDTFIGTTQIKIGQLRATADAPGIAHIAYDFSELEALNRPRSVIPASDRTSMPSGYPGLRRLQYRPLGQPAL